jgi:hypothetical protein
MADRMEMSRYFMAKTVAGKENCLFQSFEFGNCVNALC